MKTIVFLGAGASKAFGFPLTTEILPRIRQGLKKNNLFGRGKNATRQHKELSAFLGSVLPGLSKISDDNLPIITEVLSLIDYSIISYSTSSQHQRRNTLVELRKQLERAIVETLEWPYGYNDVPETLSRFVNWLHKTSIKSPGSFNKISTNYDISVEMELFEKYTYSQLENSFDFGFDWRDPYKYKIYTRPAKPIFRLYKLHGSLNWLRCPLCDHVYINLDGSIIHNAFQDPPIMLILVIAVMRLLNLC